MMIQWKELPPLPNGLPIHFVVREENTYSVFSVQDDFVCEFSWNLGETEYRYGNTFLRMKDDGEVGKYNNKPIYET